MQRIPSCGYCFKPYSFKDSGRPVGPAIPRLLQCGHTFCDSCISKLCECNACQITCPNCEAITPLPGGKKRVKDLPTNLYILGILINNIRATLEKDFTKGELCDFNLNMLCLSEQDAECNEGSEEQSDCDECCINNATLECRKCEVIFCKPCFDRVHTSSRTLRLHEATPYKLRNKENLCTTHATKELAFFDQTDNKLICALCLVSAPLKGHDVVPIAEISEKFKEKVSAVINDVQQVYTALRQSKARLDRFPPKMKSECSDVIQHIKEHFEQLHSKIQARQIELIKEVKATFCHENCVKDAVKDLYDKERKVGKLIEKATNPSSSLIINEGEDFLQSLEQVKDMSCVLSLNSLDNVVKVDYDPGFSQHLENYGKIIVENKGLEMKKLSECTNEELSDEDNVIMEDNIEQDSPTSSRSPNGNLISLPMKCNLVYVTHIKNPCDFMIQHAADVPRLETLMEAINQYCDNARALSDMVKNTQIGDVVCAQFSKDSIWYRARILSEPLEEGSSSKYHTDPVPKVELCYIDYGNSEIVPFNRLRKIKSEFMDIPELAINCSLVNIVPPLQNKTWPSKSTKVFGSLTRDKGLLMSVVKKLAGRLYVDLKSPEEEPTQDDDKPASVRDALVFLDVARFNSPASSANAKSLFPVKSYKNVVLPDEGTINEVIVTYVEDPDHLYAMIDNGQEYVDLVKIISQMSSMYSRKNGNQWNIPWPYKGLVCAGRFSGDQAWYRALVTCVGESTVDVVYVDFGNEEQLPFSEIRRLPDHMVQLPVQAMCCSLAAIQPIGDGWFKDCWDYLADLCVLNRFRMKVVKAVKDEPLSVVLYEIDHSQPSTVNQLLVDGSYASLSGDHAGHLECPPSESSLDGDDLSSTGGDSMEVKESSEDASISNDSSKSGQRRVALIPQTLQYEPVKYPSRKKFQLEVTFVADDCTIYGYQPEKYDHSLPELMKLVQNVCAEDRTSEITQEKLSINSACCAKYSGDNLWYRAEVVGFPSNTTVLVHYVDFGNKEEISLSNLKMVPAFLEIPKQCVPVELEGLPQMPEIRSLVPKHLSALLIGQQCTVSMAKPVKYGSLKCHQLTLKDGSSVLDVVKKMVKQDLLNNSRQPDSKERKMHKKKDFAPRFTNTASSTKHISLLADTCLPDKMVAFDVVVTHVDTASTVYLQRSPPNQECPGFADKSDATVNIAKDHLNQLINLSEKINAVGYFKDKQQPQDVWQGMLCCGCYSQDNMWYRAEILEMVSKTHANVVYFDYGTSEVVPINEIMCFQAELIYLPRQAFQCSIIGLKSQDGGKSKQVRKAVDKLIKVVAGKKLICKVVEFQSPILVELYERVFNEDGSYDDVPLPQQVMEATEDVDDDDISSEGSCSDQPDVEVEEIVEIVEENETSSERVESETGEIIISEERQPFIVTQLLPPTQFRLMDDTVRDSNNEQDLDGEVD